MEGVRTMVVAKKLVFALVSVAVAGCASFRPNSLVNSATWPPAQAKQEKSVRLKVDFSAKIDGRSKDVGARQVNKLGVAAGQIYDESRLFSAVRVEQSDAQAAPADLDAEVHVEHTSTTVFGWTLLTYLTVFVVPSVDETALATTTIFRNAQGEELGRVEKRQTITTWDHVLLIPLMIFRYPIPVYWWTFDDLNRATLEEARQRGIL
jgi:hypothetical protein